MTKKEKKKENRKRKRKSKRKNDSAIMKLILYKDIIYIGPRKLRVLSLIVCKNRRIKKKCPGEQI